MIELNSNLYLRIFKEIQRNKCGVYLIKDNDNDRLKSSHIKNIFSNSYSNYFYKNFSSDKSTEPYAPFFSIIKQFSYSPEEIDRLLHSINIYPIHKEIINSYLLNEEATRLEPILPFDYVYEKSKIYEGFLNILNYYSNEKTLTIVLENINFAPYSTIKWINWLLTNTSNISFKLVLTLNSFAYFDSSFQNNFDDLVQTLELNGALLELSKSSIVIRNENFSTPLNSNINFIKIGDNYFYLFALDEALHYYKIYYNNLKNNLDTFALKDFCEVIIRLGDTYCLLDQYEKASEYFDILLNYALEYGDDYYKLISNQKLSMLNILTQKYHIAENLSKQSLALAKKINIDLLILYSYNLIFWINEKAKYRTTLSSFKFEEDFIRLAKKYNQKNMLAYFLTHTFNAISYAKPEDQHIIYNNQGHTLAKELDNQNCILSAYLKTALVYAVRGFYNISIQYYEKVDSLLSEMKDYFRLAQTYNGIGYYYLTNEDFIKANYYYDKALENLRYNWNFDEICMTLLNKGLNSLLACNYKSAEHCFNIFLSIINVLKYDRLRLTTKTRVYGIIGLNNYYLGNTYKAYSFLSKMKVNSPNNQNQICKDDDDEFFLVNFLQGLLLKSEENYMESRKYFEKANDYLIKIEGSLKCLYPKFIHEYVNLLENLNDYYEAYKIRTNGINFCIDNNYTYYLSILENNNPSPLNLNQNLSHMEWVTEAAKQQASLSELNDKVDEINFLNIFQENLSSQNNLNKVITTSMTLLENRFSLEGSIISFNTSNYCDIAYSSIDKNLLNIADFEFSSLLNNNKSSFVYCRNIESSNYYFVNFFEKIIGSEICSLIYIPILKDNNLISSYICFTENDSRIFNNETTLNSENFRIIKIAINQLFETTARIQGQEKLLKSAYTDMLTTLCNRQGFYNRLSEIIFNNTRSVNTVTLFYIDLDNFKYYNDTFGHKIGDNVLIWYGSILKSVAPTNNDPIRYGGDEFLLLLEDCTMETITAIATNIYNSLDKNKGFIERICKVLDKDIYIPEDKLLSCSIGIVTMNVSNCTNIMDLVDKADKAMYEAKNLGKHRFIIK